ncbi:MAG: ATP-grasp domain-containing protein [Planctomycetes bacterium]|nr:ATP-grasp domain-containing protein [Planctomycetota bacterium]
MENTPLLILPPRHGPDAQALWRAAVRCGWDIQRLGNWQEPIQGDGRRVVIYGEPLFAQAVADRAGLVLVYPHDNFLPSIDRRFTLRDVTLATLAEARSIADRRFVKPANDKSFLAQVYASGADLPEGAGEDTPVLVSEVVDWDAEFRCFVRERELVTYSPYLRGGRLADGQDESWPISDEERLQVETFVWDFLSSEATPLPPAFVLDVGKIRGSGLAVVEANTAWGAGICGADPEMVLETLKHTCWPRDAVPDEAIAFCR